MTPVITPQALWHGVTLQKKPFRRCDFELSVIDCVLQQVKQATQATETERCEAITPQAPGD